MANNIVTMANQIARNLARGHGDPATALAEHINSFLGSAHAFPATDRARI